MSADLPNCTAIVVGGSSGMGCAIVEDLHAAGVNVVSTSRNPDTSAATAELRSGCHRRQGGPHDR